MADQFNGDLFVKDVTEVIVPLADMAQLVLKKQIRDMGVTPDTLTPPQAEELMNRLNKALSFFMGEKGTQIMKRALMKKLRHHAPEYIEGKYGLI